MMTGILQWKRKERKLLGRQDEEDWRLVVCLGRGGTEGGAKNEAQAFGLVTNVAGSASHQDEKLRRGAGLGWLRGKS